MDEDLQSARATGAAARTSDCTINDVATAANTSIRTVSRVLNKSPKVNALTRKRVEAAIAALGFRPSARARGLATGQSFLIGAVHNDRNALVVDNVHRGIVSEAGRRGYELVVHPTLGDGDSTDDIVGFVRRSHVDGLVILPPVWALPGLSERLTEISVPAIIFSSVPVKGYPAQLVANEREGAAAVAAYMLSCGHRSIALVSGPTTVHSAQERRAGFIDALVAAGVTLMREVEGDYGFQSGVTAAQELFAQTPRPSAIFAANDVMAAGVLKTAAALGLRVPGDVSIVGFDGSLLADMLTPSLTTVDRPLSAMAQRATRCLIDLIEGKNTITDLRVNLSLRMGESSGPVKIRNE